MFSLLLLLYVSLPVRPQLGEKVHHYLLPSCYCQKGLHHFSPLCFIPGKGSEQWESERMKGVGHLMVTAELSLVFGLEVEQTG